MSFTPSSTFSRPNVLLAIGLIAFGIIGRLLLQDVPNVETITTVSILAGALLGGVYTVLIGLIVVAGTDMVIGNTTILYYTWAAWAVMGVFGFALSKYKATTGKRVLALTGAGLTGNLFFYALTNFGVWHIGGLYPHTAVGLLDSYIMGLPFLKYQMAGTLLILPATSVVAIWAQQKLFANDMSTVAAEAHSTEVATVRVQN